MRVVSVNVGLPGKLTWNDKTVESAIAKHPVAGRVAVRRTGLDGDGVANTTNHGEPDQTVYVYPHEHYAYWAETLGRSGFAFGQFGENITMAGLTEAQACIGDRYRIGSTLLEVSQPRVPCYKQDMHIGIDGFIKDFLKSGFVGYYFRVLEEGDIGAGDIPECIHRAPEGITVQDIVTMRFFDCGDPQTLEVAANIEALSPSWREAIAKRRAQRDADI